MGGGCVCVCVCENTHDLQRKAKMLKKKYNHAEAISYHALAVSSQAWPAIEVEMAAAILYFITPWQYLQRLGMLFYILSRLGGIRQGYFLSRLGSIRQGYILSCLCGIRWGLACYSIS